MEYNEQLKLFAARIPSLTSQIKTEEGAKTALILPFIQMLGYNVFDPSEVCPECIADCGTKKGEKVDYAIMQAGKPAILVECKPVDIELNSSHLSQLYRYFSVTEARVGILTNGIVYQFYTDIDAENKMDSKPFLELNMLNLTDPQIAALNRFRKDSFDVDAILPSAIEMKYVREIKTILSTQLENPDIEFVKYFARQITHTKLTQKTIDEISSVVKRALTQFINDQINERLKSAMAPQEKVETVETPPPEEEDDRIVTTEEEIKGYYIIQAILSDAIDPSRVVMRDVRSYCGILLDDTIRKQICRLYLNSPTKKYLGLFDGEKEEKLPISDISDLYKFRDRIHAAVEKYEKK
ncbi:MAG: type I restriction enzyme HsdR N-terminal domain-containing protein [Methanomicrobiaceae archaeon]|nr:type I restriction enzyme HsdR N-terminal domain-containing protein [Methanomicrobiaceae archaeon]